MSTEDRVIRSRISLAADRPPTFQNGTPAAERRDQGRACSAMTRTGTDVIGNDVLLIGERAATRRRIANRWWR